MDAHTRCGEAAALLDDEYLNYDEKSEIDSEPSPEKFLVDPELDALYECWTIVYHRRMYKPYTGIQVLGVQLFELAELRTSHVVSVKNEHQYSQAHLASAYESERSGWFYAQKLAICMRTLPRKVQNVMNELIERQTRQWTVAVLWRARGTKTADTRAGFQRLTMQYQLVLRSRY